MERFLNVTSREKLPSSETEILSRKYFESFTDVLMVLVTFSAVIVLLPLICFKLFLQFGIMCNRTRDVESESNNSSTDLPPTYNQCVITSCNQPPPYSQCDNYNTLEDQSISHLSKSTKTHTSLYTTTSEQV